MLTRVIIVDRDTSASEELATYTFGGDIALALWWNVRCPMRTSAAEFRSHCARSILLSFRERVDRWSRDDARMQLTLGRNMRALT